MQVLFLLVVCLGSLWAQSEDFQGATHPLNYEGDPVRYNEGIATDPVAQLRANLEAGNANLEFDGRFGYLPALLKALNIPTSSQMLVFSKTSLQRRFISPGNPRAIFFNDGVYVGFIPGAPFLEISAADRNLGAVFYHLENQKLQRPVISRG